MRLVPRHLVVSRQEWSCTLFQHGLPGRRPVDKDRIGEVRFLSPERPEHISAAAPHRCLSRCVRLGLGISSRTLEVERSSVLI